MEIVCPCCGEDNIAKVVYAGESSWYVCKNCGVKFMEEHGRKKK